MLLLVARVGTGHFRFEASDDLELGFAGTNLQNARLRLTRERDFA